VGWFGWVPSYRRPKAGCGIDYCANCRSVVIVVELGDGFGWILVDF